MERCKTAPSSERSHSLRVHAPPLYPSLTPLILRLFRVLSPAPWCGMRTAPSTSTTATSAFRAWRCGRRWGGEPITMLCVDNHVDIKITATGEHIAAYTMSDDKIYYNQKDNELNPLWGTHK